MNSLLLTLLLSLPSQDPASATGVHSGLQTIKLSPASERVLTCAGLSPEERSIANDIKGKIQELRSLRAQIVAERLALNTAIDDLTLLSDSLSARAIMQEQEQQDLVQASKSAASASSSHTKQNPAASANKNQLASDAKSKSRTDKDEALDPQLDPAALVIVIERMKAPKAAAVLAKMNPKLAEDIVRRMKPSKAAKLLSAVDDKQAAIYASALVKKVEAQNDTQEQP